MQSFSIPRGQLLICEVEKTRNMSKDKFIIQSVIEDSPKFRCYREFRRISQVAIFDISFYLGVCQL